MFLYQGAVAMALAAFKYRGVASLYAPLEAALLAAVEEVSDLPEAEILIPVPQSWRARWKRGFNQSYILGASVARHLGLEVETCALRKVGGRPQVGLTGPERSRHAAASFGPGPTVDTVRGKGVFLFDDVYTTGATARACARILRGAGASVSVLTLARAPSPGYRGI